MIELKNSIPAGRASGRLVLARVTRVGHAHQEKREWEVDEHVGEQPPGLKEPDHRSRRPLLDLEMPAQLCFSRGGLVEIGEEIEPRDRCNIEVGRIGTIAPSDHLRDVRFRQLVWH